MTTEQEEPIVGIAAWVEAASDPKTSDKPDLFEHDETTDFCFPCSMCKHSERDEDLCAPCRYFGLS